MVLASNKWLSNSGDDRKSSEVVTSSNSESAKANTANTELPESNFMSTTIEADASGAGRTTEEELTSTGAALTPTSESALVDNANQNEEVPLTFKDQQQELEDQQKSFTDILKAMAMNETSFEGDLDTARQTTQSPGIEQNDGELENNNHAYTELIDATFNNMMETDLDSDPDPTDSNINMLNSDLTVKISNTPKPKGSVADEYIGSLIGGLSNRGDRAAFLSSLSIGGNLTNANTTQTIAMNNANAMSSNKPVNPVYALDTVRPSVLNAGNNSTNNKNTHIINGETITTSTNGQAKIVLYCEQSSHPFQTRTILLTPNIECKVGRLIAKCKASESNAIFDCKVLSRNHAVLWYSDDGRFYVKDTKSSNGTFINDNKLGNDAAELHYGDIVKFGVDVLENSRKEVHGCIIASVKLYLPDGRQAISIDSNSLRSQYSGESRISFDDLHRLNVYMQETSQREKALKSKLYNIQNLLDATRKNSSTCWQAMISEDQLLHRIHSLEKKIQILEKNMPENALKNEIVKLIDDKSAYQHSAKEALRNVYLERCEAMQKLVKLECDFASSENECKILREQITCTEEALRDVSERMRLLETESNDYRNEAERQQLEAKMEFEERIGKLTEKLQQREDECDSLQTRISEVLQKKRITAGRTDSHGEEENLQKQAIENLDAVIAGMDIGDDDDDDDEDAVDEDVATALQQQKQKRSKSDVYDFNGSSDSSGNEKQGDFNLQANSSKKFIDGEATIMKWLKNSDMNTKEGSIDIFNAICSNGSDSSDETEPISPDAVPITGKELKKNYTKLEKMLQNLRQHIKQLEIDIKEHPADETSKIQTDGYGEINSESESELQEKTNNQITKDQNSKKIKKTVFALHRAFEEIFDNFRHLRAAVIKKQKQLHDTVSSAALTTTQFQKVNSITKTSANMTLPEIDEVDDEHDSEEDDDNDDFHISADAHRDGNIEQSEIEELKAKLMERDRDSQHMLEMLQIECETHKQKVNELLILTESLRQEQELITNDMSPHVLRLPAVNDDVSGDGISSDSGVSSVDKTTETTTQLVTDASVNTSINESINQVENTVAAATAATAAFERQMREELAAMNSSAVQREEELIAYKESLEAAQNESLKLRQDLLKMQKQPEGTNTEMLMRTFVPMGVAVIGVLVYIIITYF